MVRSYCDGFILNRGKHIHRGRNVNNGRNGEGVKRRGGGNEGVRKRSKTGVDILELKKKNRCRMETFKHVMV